MILAETASSDAPSVRCRSDSSHLPALMHPFRCASTPAAVEVQRRVSHLG
jgi:hypothetical protein